MAEEEMQIIIKAVDEITKTLSSIESKIEKSSKKIEKNTESVSDAFKEQTGNLLVLGQAVDRADKIMSDYQNLQIRLENSTERLNNAQDRLAKAQLNLTKVQKDTNASAEDLAAAQQEVTAASRGLTIAQNNLARTQNAVFGTYVQMSMGAVQLASQLPAVIASVRNLTISSMAFVATPMGATLTATALALGVVTTGYLDYQHRLEEVQKIEEQRLKNIADNMGAMEELYNDTKRTTDALKELQGIITGIYSGQSEKEAQALYDIATQEKLIADLKSGQKINGAKSLEIEERKLEKLKLNYDAEFTKAREVFDAKQNLLTIQENSQNESQKRINDFWNKGYSDQLVYLKDTFYVELRKLKDNDFQKDYENLIKLQKEQYKLNQLKAETQHTTIFDKILDVGVNKKTSVNDAIITKRGQVIETSPDDNIIATKGGLFNQGITINIENVYGMKSDDIAKALQKELVKKGVY